MAAQWQNWGRTARSHPRAWALPRSEREVSDLVRRARGRRVRVVGGGHSWSAIAAPEDLGVSLDHLSGLIALDEARGVARVHGGTRLHALFAELGVRGYALPIVGSIAAQSIAGAIATGTHGSSLVHGNLPSLVEGLRLVDGRGDVHDLRGGDPRLPAARVHLGALGVVTEVTVRVERAFHLAETIEAMPIGQVPAHLERIARSAEYVKIWWLPHTRDAYIYRYERTTEAAMPSVARRRVFDERVLHAAIFPGVLRLSAIRALTKPIARLVGRTFQQPRRVGPSELMLSTPMPARHRETEAALPLARGGEALDRVVHAIARDRHHVNFIAEVRFVRGDDSWMSPAYGGDTCQLGAYCAGPASTAYFGSVWSELAPLGARPHWGKELDPRHDAAMIGAAWPLAARFRTLREELDPDRVFASTFHTRILGS